MLRCICKRTTYKTLVPVTVNVTRVCKLHLEKNSVCRGKQFQSLNFLQTSSLSTGRSMSTEVKDDMVLTYEDVKLKKEIILIDVREPAELIETGPLPDSINIPLKEIQFALEYLSDEEFQYKYGIPRPGLDAPLVFSCRSGNRSKAALKIALAMGYKNARHYGGGFLDWAKNTKV